MSGVRITPSGIPIIQEKAVATSPSICLPATIPIMIAIIRTTGMPKEIDVNQPVAKSERNKATPIMTARRSSRFTISFASKSRNSTYNKHATTYQSDV